ncbi:hypothetical protein [[Acholeplasma] multilocale]|uniref:hypothetical protein n=1 Tax=[Acholeplasma] multilocale TaxID=264638 RepID=UPI00047EA6D1|nr:hypothetical protein [[Acholeplasma] multilocale]
MKIKKILAMLLAIGLTASTGLSVVACSETKDDDDDGNVIQNIEKLEEVITKLEIVGKLYKPEINRENIIAKIYNLNPKSYKNLEEALIDLDLNIETKTLSSKKNYEGTVNLKWEVQDIVRLSELQVDISKVGQNFIDIKTTIITMINELNSELIEGIDYEIFGDTSSSEPIIVKVIGDSYKIEGKLIVDVSKIEINGLELETVRVSEDLGDLKQKVINSMRSLLPKNIQVIEGEDYEIVGDINKGEEVKVVALNNSKILTGEKTFTYEKVDIGEIKVGPWQVSNDGTSYKRIRKIISEFVGFKNDNLISVDEFVVGGNDYEASYITIASLTHSKLITNNFLIYVNKKVIDIDWDLSWRVGFSMKNVINIIQTKLDEIFHGIVLGEDYEIIGDTSKGGEIEIRGLETSKRVVLNVVKKFKVDKFNLQDILQIDNIKYYSDRDEVITQILNNVNETLSVYGLEVEKDKDLIIDVDPTVIGECEIKANPNSDIITGSRVIEIYPIERIELEHNVMIDKHVDASKTIGVDIVVFDFEEVNIFDKETILEHFSISFQKESLALELDYEKDGEKKSKINLNQYLYVMNKERPELVFNDKMFIADEEDNNRVLAYVSKIDIWLDGNKLRAQAEVTLDVSIIGSCNVKFSYGETGSVIIATNRSYI